MLPPRIPHHQAQVVFFNAGPKTRHRHLAIAREVASDPVSSERPYLEGGPGPSNRTFDCVTRVWVMSWGKAAAASPGVGRCAWKCVGISPACMPLQLGRCLAAAAFDPALTLRSSLLSPPIDPWPWLPRRVLPHAVAAAAGVELLLPRQHQAAGEWADVARCRRCIQMLHADGECKWWLHCKTQGGRGLEAGYWVRRAAGLNSQACPHHFSPRTGTGPEEHAGDWPGAGAERGHGLLLQVSCLPSPGVDSTVFSPSECCALKRQWHQRSP